MTTFGGFATCRLCKKCGYETPKEGMVQYAVRHHCHVSCGIERWGIDEFLSKLTPYQISKLPALTLDKYPGAIEKAEAITGEHEVEAE